MKKIEFKNGAKWVFEEKLKDPIRGTTELLYQMIENGEVVIELDYIKDKDGKLTISGLTLVPKID